MTGQTFERRFAALRPLLAAGLAAGLAACAGAKADTGGKAAGLDRLAAETRTLSDAGLARLSRDMDTAALALARRHDPVRKTDYWGRPVGWETFYLAKLPSLGFGTTVDETARRINALKPYAAGPIEPMRPFVLKTDAADRARALRCLTQAVYYEAATEPTAGQEAVAQIVLNRVRHPAYPNTICGVVYQGSALRTGCQFSFTCDGALARAPSAGGWARAQAVAKRALDGFVLDAVGPATHYHADYVSPYWAPTLVKLTRIGEHIFYRWTGPGGEPAAFVGRYSGKESNVSMAVMAGVDARTQGEAPPEAVASPRSVTLAVAGDVRTYTVADPTAPGGERARVAGVLTPSRRKPTTQEIQEINARLAAMETGANAASATDEGVAASAAVSP